MKTMAESTTDRQIHDFPKHNLRLIYEESRNATFTLVNTRFDRDKKFCIKWLLVLFFAGISLFASDLLLVKDSNFISKFRLNSFKTFLSLSFAVIFVYLSYRLWNLVEKEIVQEAFGLQKFTVKTFGTTDHLFLPRNSISKVVINEVIYFVS